MKSVPIAILGTGLVTSVGATAAACCSAFRAKLTNPIETQFIDSSGEWIMAHQVELTPPRAGLSKLVRMATWAIEDALQALEKEMWCDLPLLLCVAETERPGRMAGLDDELLTQIQIELGVEFATSKLVPHGRVAVAVALEQARTLILSTQSPGVLIVGVDSLLSWPTLSQYERHDRLLTESNSDGFMPGEGAGALWVGRNTLEAAQLLCTGIGFGLEPASINSGEPSRAQGLTQAIKASVDDAGRQLYEMAFRITDNSGEQHYFKEATVALLRLLREDKETFDIWHPAECTGEVGAVSGISVIAAAVDAFHKGYSPGQKVLAHWSNDVGQRAAITMEFRVAA